MEPLSDKGLLNTWAVAGGFEHMPKKNHLNYKRKQLKKIPRGPVGNDHCIPGRYGILRTVGH